MIEEFKHTPEEAKNWQPARESEEEKSKEIKIKMVIDKKTGNIVIEKHPSMSESHCNSLVEQIKSRGFEGNVEFIPSELNQEDKDWIINYLKEKIEDYEKIEEEEKRREEEERYSPYKSHKSFEERLDESMVIPISYHISELHGALKKFQKGDSKSVIDVLRKYETREESEYNSEAWMWIHERSYLSDKLKNLYEKKKEYEKRGYNLSVPPAPYLRSELDEDELEKLSEIPVLEKEIDKLEKRKESLREKEEELRNKRITLADLIEKQQKFKE